MTSPALIVFGTWIAQDGHLDEVIEAASSNVQYAREYPQDLLSLYVMKGISDHPNAHEVRTVSWFKSRRAYLDYLQSPIMVKAKIHCENKRLLQTPQFDRLVSPLAGFIRREMTHSDPFVVVASVRFKPSRRVDGTRMFEKIAQAVEVEEPGAYTYMFMADAHDEGLMWNFERYEDEIYLRQIHAPRDDVQRNMRDQQDIRQPGGLHHWYWKQIAEVQNPGL
ncbi:hypothetical protein CLAIMM_14569 [Cladophialophora immunda]|nr:hypothetical protein CLAIMM_14569 [Cladophialophora immunda]